MCFFSSFFSPGLFLFVFRHHSITFWHSLLLCFPLFFPIYLSIVRSKCESTHISGVCVCFFVRFVVVNVDVMGLIETKTKAIKSGKRRKRKKRTNEWTRKYMGNSEEEGKYSIIHWYTRTKTIQSTAKQNHSISIHRTKSEQWIRQERRVNVLANAKSGVIRRVAIEMAKLGPYLYGFIMVCLRLTFRFAAVFPRTKTHTHTFIRQK